MFSSLRFHLTALALIFYAVAAPADSMTYYGDFEDFFDSSFYLFSDPSEPGSSFLLDEAIVGIPKFDASLGTLTDIILTVEESTIMLGLDGSFEATQLDDSMEFGGFASIFGEIGVFYIKETPTITTLETFLQDTFFLDGSCGGGPGDGGCSEPAFAGTFSGDDSIVGEVSIFGDVLLDDFVGPGEVELSVGLLAPISAEFDLFENVDLATLEFSFDVFDGATGVDGDTVGITYVYSPVPVPAAWLMFLPAAWVVIKKKRKA